MEYKSEDVALLAARRRIISGSSLVDGCDIFCSKDITEWDEKKLNIIISMSDCHMSMGLKNQRHLSAVNNQLVHSNKSFEHFLLFS